ncbi:MAG: hypothetical protein Q8K94_03535 [Moraxellaceae bacterium]|nr:hypothetical protein [Moraxellaceae bacterium]
MKTVHYLFLILIQTLFTHSAISPIQKDLASFDEPSVQSIAEIEKNLPERVAELNAVAERLYIKWIAHLK